MKSVKILSVLLIAAVMWSGPCASAKDKNATDLIRTFSLPIDEIYGAVVQVAASNYNLKAAVKEGYTVNFFTGGRYSLILTAICHDNGSDQTTVTLSISKAEGNPQIFGLGGEMDKQAKRFWMQLDSTLKSSQVLRANSAASKTTTTASESSEVTVNSAPDGADILVDGKFCGNTPSTLHLPPGDHNVTITKKGFQSWERSVTVGAGAKITISATLEAESAKQ